MNNLSVMTNHAPATYIQPSIFTLIQQWIGSLDIKPSSKQSYEKYIKYFAEYLRSNEIEYPNKQDVLDYKLYLEELDLKPTSFNNYLRIMKLFFKWLYEEDKGMDLAKGIKLKKLSEDPAHRPLTLPQVKRLMKSIDTSTLKGFRDYVMIKLIITLGLRTIEVSRLSWSDLTSSGTIMILGKGRDTKIERAIPFELYDLLMDYKLKLNIQSNSEPMFQKTSNYKLTKSGESNRLTTHAVSQTIVKHLINSGVRGKDDTDICAHSLRNTSACLALDEDCSLYDIQNHLGHKNPQTTEIYLKRKQRLENPVAQIVYNLIKE